MDAVEVGPSPAPLFRVICTLAGVDPALIAACPPRDRDGLRLLAALMMLVWLWQSAVFAAVGHLMLAGPGEIRAELSAGAVLLATIILLLDAYVVMRPSWTTFGYEELRRGGLAIHLLVLARVKSGLFLALRLALSAVVGTLVALFVSLILYGKDIAGQLAAEHTARNAPVIVAATRLIDDRLARNVGAQADLRARIAVADRVADGLRRGFAETADPAVAAGPPNWPAPSGTVSVPRRTSRGSNVVPMRRASRGHDVAWRGQQPGVTRRVPGSPRWRTGRSRWPRGAIPP